MYLVETWFKDRNCFLWRGRNQDPSNQKLSKRNTELEEGKTVVQEHQPQENCSGQTSSRQYWIQG